VGEAAEPLDDVVMFLREAELIVVTERAEQGHRAALVLDVLAVLEGHVEEAALGRAHRLVEAAVDRAPGDRQSERIGRELIGVAAQHVARELVEQDDGRDRVAGAAEEGVGHIFPLGLPQAEEALAYLGVERRVGLPPLRV
jgi:hypothetical protein